MMTLRAKGYPRPRSAEEFERLCLRLLRRHWQLPELERFRRTQSGDSAIDLLEISGRPRLIAVRCGFSAGGRSLRGGDLGRAAELAVGTKLPIGRFVYVTDARRSGSLEHETFELNRTHHAARLCTVELLCWEDVEELLDEYPGMLTEFQTAARQQVVGKLEAATWLEPCWPFSDTEPSDRFDEEISVAASYLERGEYQMARLWLMRIRENGWGEIGSERKFVVLSALAIAWLGEGETRKAAMLLIAAKSLQPNDEKACTNEALAYQILGQREKASKLAEELRMQFPGSTRALALWLSNAPEALSAEELENDIPPELATDGDVATVMARRALAGGDHDRAERFARQASVMMSRRPDPWLVLGQALLLKQISGGDSARAGAEPASEDSLAGEAEGCFSTAIKLAQNENSPANTAQALIGRAQARIALQDTDGAGADLEEAHQLDTGNSNGLCEYALLLRARGRLSEAIEALRRAVGIGGRPDTRYHLAIALRDRDDPGDLKAAAELLSHAISDPGGIPPGHYPFAVETTVRALSRLERWREAEALLDSLGSDRLPEVTCLVLRAELSLSEGHYGRASELAGQAIAALDSHTAADTRRKLACLLQELGRLGDALKLWQSLDEESPGGADSRRLFNCALRLGRADIALGVARTVRPKTRKAADGADFELELLERTNPEAALRLIETRLAKHPEDRTLRLRASLMAHRLGRGELVSCDPKVMPKPGEVSPALGRAAVRMMRGLGRPDAAISYAYELLRKNPDAIDAHRAYLEVLSPSDAMPRVPDFESAATGAAVCLVEQDQEAERWVILEDHPEADEEQGEYGTSHPLARSLEGKRVGEKFTLPGGGRLSRKSAVVKQIISKFAYRYQDCLAGWEARFCGRPEIEVRDTPGNQDLHLAADPADGYFPAPNGGSANGFGSIDKRDANHPLPIHAVSKQLNVNDLQTVFSLSQRPDMPIRCCTGSERELEEALGALARSSRVVMDLTAIATLCLLGRLNLLAAWPRDFVISQGTFDELRRLQFAQVLMRLPPGFSAAVTSNGASVQRSDVQLRQLADTIRSVCKVAEGCVLEVLAPEKRRALEELLGRHGAESVVLGSLPGNVLWTDDGVMAEVAKAEFATRRVWTLAALQSRVQAGTLNPAELTTAQTKLAGWGYGFTAPGIESLMRAGSVAGWNPEQFPLKQALEGFAADTIALPDAVRLAAELIVKLYNDVYLRGSRRLVTVRVLDRIAQRPGGLGAIEALPRSLQVRFGLDLIRARELSGVVRGWMGQHEPALRP